MKVLFISLPNDLGSRTIETNLYKFISSECDVKLFRFAAHDANHIDYHISNKKNVLRRFQDSLKLRSEIKKAVKEKRKILFYNVSPALFSLGCWHHGEAYITMDWAGRLFDTPTSLARKLVSLIHEKIFQSCTGLLPMTAAMADCLEKKYRVPSSKIHLVPSLFDVEHFDPGEIKLEDKIRVLYVGGDVKRKGGDLLYKAFSQNLHNQCSLTMVTNHDFPHMPGFTLHKNIRYGNEEHRELMRNHDVFVLPTFMDSGPQVIGEAAAAGLAVITTRQALGAIHVVKEGINGFIAENPADCITKLAKLLHTPNIIINFRHESLKHMRSNYSKSMISSAYMKALS